MLKTGADLGSSYYYYYYYYYYKEVFVSYAILCFGNNDLNVLFLALDFSPSLIWGLKAAKLES